MLGRPGRTVNSLTATPLLNIPECISSCIVSYDCAVLIVTICLICSREQRQKDSVKMAANSFPRDMDYRQEALQDKATTSESYLWPIFCKSSCCTCTFLWSNKQKKTRCFHRDHIRGPAHSIQPRPFLICLFLSEPELCSCYFRLHPFHRALHLLLVLLFGPGCPVCPVPVACAAAGPCHPASAPPSTAGNPSDEQRQYGHGQAQRGSVRKQMTPLSTQLEIWKQM